MKKIISALTKVLLLGIILLCSNCKKEAKETVVVPTNADAVFSYNIDKENPNMVHFKSANKVPAWYTYWDFGAGAFGDGLDITKVFFKKGTYKVKMKIFTVGGTAESTKDIIIANDFKGKNLIKGGQMLTGDEVNWSILNIANGVNWKFNNGSATASGGNWGHKGIYQAIPVEAGTKYRFDARVFGSGGSDIWFEAYLNEKVPVDGSDYKDVPVAIGLNTWSGCGKTAFDDKLSVISCAGKANEVQFNKTGTIYLVIKTGGSNLGSTGISITDIEFYAIN